MTTASLNAVLLEIIELLRQYGHTENAAWLDERRQVHLDPEATEDALEHARNELHSVVLGMGGLVDLSLSPEPGSPFTTLFARERLDALSDDLYDLTS